MPIAILEASEPETLGLGRFADPPEATLAGPDTGVLRAMPATAALDALAASLAGRLHELARPLCRAAEAFVRGEGWCELGYARPEDFARERLGRSGRWLRDLAALGRVALHSEELLAALTGRDGGPPLGTVAALAIARGTSGEFRSSWIALARALGVRELKRRLRQSRAAGVPFPVDDTGERDDTWRPPDALLVWIAAAGPAAFPVPVVAEFAAQPWNRRYLERLGLRVAEGSPPRGEAGEAEADPATPLEPGANPIWTAPVCFGSPLDDAAGPDDHAPPAVLRLDLPAPIVAAFHETRRLHGRVSGRDGSIADFVEALVGEARAAGFAPRPDLEGALDRLVRSAFQDDLEREMRCDALRRQGARGGDSAPDGASLESPASGGSPEASPSIRKALAAADTLLARAASLFAAAGNGDAAQLAAQLRALVDLEQPIRRALGGLLVELGRRRGWKALGYASLRHYTEARLGISRSCAEDLATLCRALETLAVVDGAYASGRLSSLAALRIVRILRQAGPSPELEQRWVAHAEGLTIKRLDDEREVLRCRRLTVNDRDAAAAGPAPLSDAEWHAALHRAPGESTARLERWARRAAEMSEAVATLRLVLPFDLAADFLGALEAAARRVRTFSPELSGFDARWLGLYALLTGYASAHDSAKGPRGVYARDGWRCMAPGCTSCANLEEHHLVYRAQGGDDLPGNRVTLCRYHHQRGEHGGRMRVRGRAPLALVFELDGRCYRNERAAPVNSPVAPSFLTTAAAGQKPVKADWNRLSPTKAVSRYHHGETK